MKRLAGEDFGCGAFAVSLAEAQGEVAETGLTGRAVKTHTYVNKCTKILYQKQNVQNI